MTSWVGSSYSSHHSDKFEGLAPSEDKDEIF